LDDHALVAHRRRGVLLEFRTDVPINVVSVAIKVLATV